MLDIYSYLTLHKGNCCLFGMKNHNVKGEVSVSISKGDVLFLEHILSENPDFMHCAEFGTWAGITSMYLGMAMRIRGGKLFTFDIGDFRPKRIKIAWLDNMTFVRENVLEPDSRVLDFIKKIISTPKTLVFFDNGNKIKEVSMYAQYIIPGSGFLVHDWNNEIKISDIQKTLDENNFVMEYENAAEFLHSHLRFFRKK